MIILVDHNVEGQALLLSGTIAAHGWLDLLPLQLVTFSEVGLPFDSRDLEVWRFAQARRMILLTGNRSMKEENSLEQTIREENTPTSLPVITLSDPARVDEKDYRERCGSRLIEVVVYLDHYLGAGRVFIP